MNHILSALTTTMEVSEYVKDYTLLPSPLHAHRHTHAAANAQGGEALLGL
jgi:hypothetical protein